MCDVEEFISRTREVRLEDDMDLYITDSLQDMLDMDIKSEMATDLGSGTDFSDALGLSFSDMPPLLDMDTDNSATWVMSTHSSSFVHNLDLYGSEANAVMVNPNSVMPSIFADTPPKKIVNETSSNLMLNSVNNNTVKTPLASPKQEKSHLTFSPTIKLIKPKEDLKQIVVKKEQSDRDEPQQMVIYVRKDVKKDLQEDDTKKFKLTTTPVATPLLRLKTSQSEVLKINNKNCSILNNSHKITTQPQPIGPKTIISGNIHILGAQQSRTILSNGNRNQATILIDNNRQLIKTTVGGTFTFEGVQQKYVAPNKTFVGEFPKPAYSYSCLIAMALKNSRTGSLPVSEIYNFMCQHFPYFKTAPNGWKNSVRHNLSLNKCFEKIEKPSTNGGQRKGCLWAMNPTKVSKMDEEVQKWSRKDPQAIRKAMVFPDNLEALERGEMKYSGGGSEGEGEDADTDLDPDVEQDDDVEGLEEQELSSEELEVEAGEVGSYRLLTPTDYIDHSSPDQHSDIDVMDHISSYDEIDIGLSRPVKLEFALDDYEDNPAKRVKSNFIYQPTALTTTAHQSRRKTPLVNRNYKIC